MAENPYEAPKTRPAGTLRRPASKLGAASALIAAVCLLIDFGIGLYVLFRPRAFGPSTEILMWREAATLGWAPAAGAAVGLALGVASLFVRNRSRRLGAAGVALGALLLVAFFVTWKIAYAPLRWVQPDGTVIEVELPILARGVGRAMSDNPYRSPASPATEPGASPSPRRVGQSRAGVASAVIGIVAWTPILLVFARGSRAGVPLEFVDHLLDLCAVVAYDLSVLGFGLSLFALCQLSRERHSAIFGFALNGAILVYVAVSVVQLALD